MHARLFSQNELFLHFSSTCIRLYSLFLSIFCRILSVHMSFSWFYLCTLSIYICNYNTYHLKAAFQNEFYLHFNIIYIHQIVQMYCYLYSEGLFISLTWFYLLHPFTSVDFIYNAYIWKVFFSTSVTRTSTNFTVLFLSLFWRVDLFIVRLTVVLHFIYLGL